MPSESYITAAGSEKPLPEAAISGRPKKPVLPTAVATIIAPARGRSMPQMRTETVTMTEQDEVDGEAGHRHQQQRRVEVGPHEDQEDQRRQGEVDHDPHQQRARPRGG